MLKRFLHHLVFCAAICLIWSCSDHKTTPLIGFSADRSSIVIKNIDEASLLQLKNLYQTPADSLHLVSVLLTPGDQDSMQMEEEIDGKLVLQGDSLVFKPTQPFVKGKNYLVENYIGVQFGNAGKLLKGSLKYNLKPQQQILTR